MDNGEFEKFSEDGVWALLDGGSWVFKADAGFPHRVHRLVVESPVLIFSIFVGKIRRYKTVFTGKRLQDRMHAIPKFIGDAVSQKLGDVPHVVHGVTLSCLS